VGLSVYSSLLQSNGSVNTFPRQLRVDGGVAFSAVLVVSKASTQLVSPRSSCLLNGGKGFQIWRTSRNMFNYQFQKADNGWSLVGFTIYPICLAVYVARMGERNITIFRKL
jgi:hypothetical protein